MSAWNPITPAWWGDDLNGTEPDPEQPDTAPDQAKPDLGDELGDAAGKIWNAPSTVAGLISGGLGYLAGWPSYWLGLQDEAPDIKLGNNGVQFTNNPYLAPHSAMTMGNTQIFGGKPTDRPNPGLASIGQHEQQHSYQGQQLGPLYPPSNIPGGAAGLLINGRWHGPHNWNEAGPQQPVPRPWLT